MSLLKKEKRFTVKNPNYTERTYFEVNRFNRSVPLNENETYYQGTSIGVSNSWRPYGKGEFTLDEKPLLKGTFNRKGLPQGYGEFVFYRDGKPWKTFKGHFMDGNMAGAGVLVDADGIEEEVIAKDNEVICTRADLDVGTQLELNDFSLHVHAGTQRCIVLRHVKNWVYRVRFHEDQRPVERDVDLAGLKRFRVLRHLPKVPWRAMVCLVLVHVSLVLTYFPCAAPLLPSRCRYVTCRSWACPWSSTPRTTTGKTRSASPTAARAWATLAGEKRRKCGSRTCPRSSRRSGSGRTGKRASSRRAR
jgi:hypothetical protein